MSQVQIITHGDYSTPLCIKRSITRSRDGLDRGSLEYSAGADGLFAPGTTPTDSPGLIIDSSTSDRYGDEYIYNLQVTGIDGSKPDRRVLGWPRVQHNLTDWDTAEDQVIAANANYYVEGQVGSFGGTTFCTSVTTDDLYLGRVFRVTARFSGVIRSKPRQRIITVNGLTISGDAIIVPMPGGWYDPAKGVVQVPKIVVKDRYLGSSPPPTIIVGGPAVPPDPPAIRDDTVGGTELTKYFPGGWWASAIDSEEIIPGLQWAFTITYEYQYPVLPS